MEVRVAAAVSAAGGRCRWERYDRCSPLTGDGVARENARARERPRDATGLPEAASGARPPPHPSLRRAQPAPPVAGLPAVPGKPAGGREASDARGAPGRDRHPPEAPQRRRPPRAATLLRDGRMDPLGGRRVAVLVRQRLRRGRFQSVVGATGDRPSSSRPALTLACPSGRPGPPAVAAPRAPCTAA